MSKPLCYDQRLAKKIDAIRMSVKQLEQIEKRAVKSCHYTTIHKETIALGNALTDELIKLKTAYHRATGETY